MSSWMDYFRRRGGSRYAPLPANDSTDEIAPGPAPNHVNHITAEPQSRGGSPLERARRARRLAGFTAVTLMAAMLGYLTVGFLQPSSRPCDTPGHGFQCSNPITHYWGQYSPYFSVPSHMDPAIPKGCELTFAQVLSRHGARAPTASRAAYYANLIDRIHAGAIYYSPGFHFLANYNYTLGADDLTPLGEQQMVNSGLKFYRRYRALARTAGAPFVRTAGQERVVRSAENFTQGFHTALLADRKSTSSPPTLPYPMVVIPETPANKQNNTLHHGLCTAFESGAYSNGAAAQATYLSTFAPPLTARLNTALPGANLSDADTIALMDLCPFETVAGPGDGSLSPFCNLFSPPEWRQYDYFQTLGKWYDFGPGCALGPTQGVGWVNELLARLTGRPVKDATSTNSTLDGDVETFPLGRGLYADFSHDNDMVGVLGSLLYDGVKGTLDNTTRREPEEVEGFAVSWLVPFAARVYVEKMRCAGEEGEKVRVLVNDRVAHLPGCEADGRGMCELGQFVESMAFARGGGKWDMCFA